MTIMQLANLLTYKVPIRLATKSDFDKYVTHREAKLLHLGYPPKLEENYCSSDNNTIYPFIYVHMFGVRLRTHRISNKPKLQCCFNSFVTVGQVKMGGEKDE